MSPIEVILWLIVIIAIPFALYALVYIAIMLFFILVMMWATITAWIDG